MFGAMVCMATDFHAVPTKRHGSTSATMRKGPRALLVAALSVSLLMSGCTKTVDPAENPTTPPATATPVPSTTPDPTPTPTPEPDPTPTAPDPSQVINENTEEGAKSAVEYFFALHDYTYAARDATVWKTIGAEDCEFCLVVTGQIQELLAENKHLEGGKLSIAEISFVTEYKENNWGIGLEVTQEPALIHHANGTTENLQEEQVVSNAEALLKFEDSRWILVDIG